MGRRKKHEEEHENHERWLVSYADFITLLFAFFVVMYALSSVNEGKYRVLSSALSSAFHDTPSKTNTTPVDIRPVITGLVQPRKPMNAKLDEATKQKKERMRNMAREILGALAPMVKSGQVNVAEGVNGITIEISSNVLFAPGEARLNPAIVADMAMVGRILAKSDFPIIIEGHTDNVPISNTQFPSNWELSGVRASSVVRLFIENGVDAKRLTATGYADQRPLEDNSTAEGRQRNRRVAINLDSQVPDSGSDITQGPASVAVTRNGVR